MRSEMAAFFFFCSTFAEEMESNSKHRYNDPVIHGVKRANRILLTPSEYSSGIRPYRYYWDDDATKMLECCGKNNTQNKWVIKRKFT